VSALAVHRRRRMRGPAYGGCICRWAVDANEQGGVVWPGVL